MSTAIAPQLSFALSAQNNADPSTMTVGLAYSLHAATDELLKRVRAGLARDFANNIETPYMQALADNASSSSLGLLLLSGVRAAVEEALPLGYFDGGVHILTEEELQALPGALHAVKLVKMTEGVEIVTVVSLLPDAGFPGVEAAPQA